MNKYSTGSSSGPLYEVLHDSCHYLFIRQDRRKRRFGTDADGRRCQPFRCTRQRPKASEQAGLLRRLPDVELQLRHKPVNVRHRSRHCRQFELLVTALLLGEVGMALTC